VARHPKGTCPKLTARLIKTMARAIGDGAYVETAAALSGISKDTLYRWLRMAEGEHSTPLHRELSDAVKKGMARAEQRDLAVIDKAAQQGIWQAAAWRLERKHPDRWGRQSKVQLEHSGPDGGPIELDSRVENLKMLLADPDALTALETIEVKLLNGTDPKVEPTD